ncbi:MAG: hypothetical protein ACSLEL_02825 [Candidatus Malihini olakiniferum]
MMFLLCAFWFKQHQTLSSCSLITVANIVTVRSRLTDEAAFLERVTQDQGGRSASRNRLTSYQVVLTQAQELARLGCTDQHTAGYSVYQQLIKINLISQELDA